MQNTCIRFHIFNRIIVFLLMLWSAWTVGVEMAWRFIAQFTMLSILLLSILYYVTVVLLLLWLYFARVSYFAPCSILLQRCIIHQLNGTDEKQRQENFTNPYLVLFLSTIHTGYTAGIHPEQEDDSSQHNTQSCKCHEHPGICLVEHGIISRHHFKQLYNVHHLY